MSSLAKELLVDPWRRLKWGFIPVRREVTDLDAGEAKELVPSEVEKEEGTSLELSGDRTSSADGELTKEEFRETKKTWIRQAQIFPSMNTKMKLIGNGTNFLTSKSIVSKNPKLPIINGTAGSMQEHQLKKKNCC